MEIRKLEIFDDKYKISHIYEKSWKYAYKGIIEQEYLDKIPVGNWIDLLRRSDRNNVLLMIEKNEFIGTSYFCKSRFPQFENYGEIVSIYLLPEFIGKGYGRKLFEYTVNSLIEQGYKDIFLWVLEDNIRARNFYEKNGFVLGKNSLDVKIGTKNLKEVQYFYSNRVLK